MEVEFEFLLGGEPYRVIRKRSRARGGQTLLELQMRQGDDWRAITGNTVRETERKIIDLLRMDYETFINCTFLLQGRADEFTVKPPTQRKQILADILGLSVYDELETKAKDAGQGARRPGQGPEREPARAGRRAGPPAGVRAGPSGRRRARRRPGRRPARRRGRAAHPARPESPAGRQGAAGRRAQAARGPHRSRAGRRPPRPGRADPPAAGARDAHRPGAGDRGRARRAQVGPAGDR